LSVIVACTSLPVRLVSSATSVKKSMFTYSLVIVKVNFSNNVDCWHTYVVEKLLKVLNFTI